MDEDPRGLTESCDCCNRVIRNFDWMCMSFLDFHGKIRCMWCKSEFVKECIQARRFDLIGIKESELVI